MAHTTPLLDWLEAGVSIAPFEARELDIRLINYYAMGVVPIRPSNVPMTYYTLSVEAA